MLAYERFGEGAPLVLIHGLGHRRQAWYPVAHLLAPHRELILVDLPGHGTSPAFEPRGRSFRQYLREEFEAFYSRLGLRRPHVAGNSLGGLIALEAAAQGRASSATALSPAGFWRGDGYLTYLKGLFTAGITAADVGRPVLPVLASATPGRALMYAWVTARPAHIGRQTAIGDLRGLIRARPAVRAALAETYAFDAPLPADVPVTIGWGRQDRVLCPAQARRARHQLPGATHEWLAGCGHVPMADQPRLVADLILRGSEGPLLPADEPEGPGQAGGRLATSA